MSARDCIQGIIDASKGVLSEDDVADLTDDIAKRADRRRRQFPNESRQENLIAVAKELQAEEELAAMIEKRNRTINVLKKKARFARYDAQAGREAVALDSLNVGSERGFDGAALSVDGLRMGYEDALTGTMIRDLRQAGLLDLLAKRNREFDLDVARELWRISDEAAPASGNKAAEEAAKVIARTQEAARVMQNQRGAFIRKLPGWIVRQTHDAVAVANAGFEAWRSAILPRLDERTFDGVTDREAFLQHAWRGIVTGVHRTAQGADSWLGGFKGYSNRAKAVSQERVLHFKSADDWFAYNEQFGSAAVLEAVVDGLGSAARNSALMDIWGTNPEAAFRADLDQLRSRKTISEAQIAKLGDWRVEANFQQVNGTANTGGLPGRAQFHANVRAWITMSKLGGVVLSSVPDIAVQASALRHNGVGYFEALANGFASIMRGRGDAEAREIADLINAGTQGIVGRVFDRFGVNDGAGGKMSKAMRLFFRANLLEWWTDSMKTGIGLMLSKNLARYQSKAFGALPELLRINLQRYGIGEREWAVMQQLDTKFAKGERYLTADAIDRLPDQVIKDYAAGVESKGGIARTRSELAAKLNTYYASEIRTAMTEAGARERTIATFGTSSQTPIGIAVRYLMQFKTYGITFATRHIAREFLRTGKLDKTGLFALMLGTTTLGYVSMTAKEWVKGRNPRKVEDMGDAANVIGAAMVQGGGLGIYGDFLFGEYNRFGGGLVGTLGGPAVGTVEDLFKLYSSTKDYLKGDRERAPAAEAFNIAKDNTPFLNLFYARMAADHLFLFKIQEAMNPGYLQRMEKRVERDNAQSFWLPPSSAVGR